MVPTMSPGAPVLSDWKARQLLRRRDRDEEAAARRIARRLAPGTCPVCEQDPPGPEEQTPLGLLVPSPPPPLLWPFLRRPALRCTRCGLSAPACPGRIGWVLALVLALGLALGGMSAIFAAQRLDEPLQRGLFFLWGAVLFAGGLVLGYGVQGAGSASVLAHRVMRARRRLRRRREGTPREEALPEPGWFAENLEAVVVAVILALIIRHFVMEAFVIPTGSMAPTLLGDHFRIECTSCRFPFALGKDENELLRADERVSVRARCPLCETDLPFELRRADVVGGDKILVNKFAYQLRPPRRFEVIVFKYPKNPTKNFIKRLIGLPGERISIKNGDLWVNGARCRKPPEVQDAIWMPVFDARYPRAERGGQPVWRVPTDQAWEEGAWDLSREERPVGRAEPGRAGPWLELNRDVDDSYGYARVFGSGRTARPVADMRIAATVTCHAPGAIRLAILEDERVVAARFPVGEGRYAVEVGGAPQVEVEGAPLPVGVPVEVALAYADDHARLLVGGRPVLEWDDPFGPEYTRQTSRPRLQVEGCGASFDGLRVDRDVHWVPGSDRSGRHDPTEDEVRVDEDSYFVMGDHSPSSEDSRVWGVVRRGHLIGRAFLVFWPVVPWQVKAIQ